MRTNGRFGRPLRPGASTDRAAWAPRVVIVVTLMMSLFFQANPAAAGAVFDRVMERGTVRIGVPYNLTPQGYFDARNRWVGFEVDLAEELAKLMNLKLEKVKVNPKTWGPALEDGRIDAALCRIKHTRSLESEFDFSVPYFFDAPHVLTLKGRFNSVEDLKGLKLAAVQGTNAEKRGMALLLKAGDPDAESNVVSYPDRAACFMALGREKAAGWIDSGVALLEYASKSPGRFETLKASDSVEPLAVAVPEDDSAWRDLINFTIQDMAAQGALKRIHDKWFGPGTPYAFPLAQSIEIWSE